MVGAGPIGRVALGRSGAWGSAALGLWRGTARHVFRVTVRRRRWGAEGGRAVRRGEPAGGRRRGNWGGPMLWVVRHGLVNEALVVRRRLDHWPRRLVVAGHWNHREKIPTPEGQFVGELPEFCVT